ncbi:MAG: hypothetical protein ACXVRZ_00920 [Gaiellaceae bacterium]
MPLSPKLVDLPVARALAGNAFPVEQGTVVYVDRALREPGEVAVGGEEVRSERATVVVFRDEAPGANWMHPCTYALVDLETGDVVERRVSDRPPNFGWLPDTWVVAADPDGRADLVAPDNDL